MAFADRLPRRRRQHRLLKQRGAIILSSVLQLTLQVPHADQHVGGCLIAVVRVLGKRLVDDSFQLFRHVLEDFESGA